MRVTDLRGVDLARYAFDFDLTFSALLMHADGHVYHRYGGRDHSSPTVWLGLESQASLLRATLVEHEAYAAAPQPPAKHEALRLEAVKSYARRDKGECIHCHMVLPALHEEALAAGRWRDGDLWMYPDPARIGLVLDPVDQARIVSVEEGSAAQVGGLLAGDRLVALGEQRILTATDVQWALHHAASTATQVPVRFVRDGAEHEAVLALADGWRVGSPLDFSWRPFKWHLTPQVGFGGPMLSDAERRRLGLAADAFAMRVNYIVTWDEFSRYGKEATRAGLRKDDVVVSAGGRTDFASIEELHAWWTLTREPGETVEVVVLRGGERRVLEVNVLP